MYWAAHRTKIGINTRDFSVFITVLTNIHLFWNTMWYLLVNREVPVEISAAIFRIPEMDPEGADKKLLRYIGNFQSTRLHNPGYLNLQ
jgi:hypothetical protein